MKNVWIIWRKYTLARLILALLSFASSAFAKETTIQPGDVIHLSLPIPIMDEVSFTNFYRIDETGMVTLPLAIKVKVAGVTCIDAARAISDRCSAEPIASHKTATVTIGGPEPFVTVAGQIRHGGKVGFRFGLGVLQLINEAGGFTDSGNQSRVKLGRAATNGVTIVNVTKIIQNPSLDVLLSAGDKVCVEAR